MLLKGDSGLTSRPEEYPAEYYLQFLFTFKLWLTEQRTLVLNLHSTVLPSIAKTYRRKKNPTTNKLDFSSWFQRLLSVCMFSSESREKKNH